MADVFSGFSGFGAMGGTIMLILQFLGIFLVVGIPLVFGTVMIIKKMKEKIIYELNLINGRVKKYTGAEKKNKAGQRQLYIGKLKKFMPRVQQRDVFLQGKQDAVFLIKDNNGLHHTARLPTQEELEMWYKNVHGVDIKEHAKKVEDYNTYQEQQALLRKKNQGFLARIKNRVSKRVTESDVLNVVSTVYLLPNPGEEIDWLANQCREADKQFASGLLKHPLAAWIGTLAILAFVTIIWLIIMKKM